MTTDPADPSVIFLGIDTGGTFTDFVLLEDGELKIHKVLSTPESPDRAIIAGIQALGLTAQLKTGQLHIIHGSTVATNAALEGKGVKTAFITNQGFKDLLSIGRQTRAELYNLQPNPAPIPVPAEHCFELHCRIDAKGNVLNALEQTAVEQLIQQLLAANVDAVAVLFLFSFLNPLHEQLLKEALNKHFFVSASSEVLPESGEYERGIATWLNASLGPKVNHYLASLESFVKPSPLAIMQSTGGTIQADFAARNAARLLLSGPAGGLAAAHYIAQQTGLSKLLTFDMGGTSTDVAVIDGTIQLTNEGRIGPWPVAVPQVDMHTIGAGGGSIAQVDSAGLLLVGPESAGADPGPACYGRSGSQATVTDANVVLGRLQPDYFLGGNMTLDTTAAEAALDKVAEALNISRLDTAQGIIRIANEHMARALRVISIERGYDLKQFQLCCFGGAGGLHVCALAETLGIKKALVPRLGGVLSALGMVVAPKSRELSCPAAGSLEQQSAAALQTSLDRITAEGVSALKAEGIATSEITTELSVDLRYQGQRFYLNIPWQQDLVALKAAFEETHQQRYGHRLNAPVELVNARASVVAPAAVQQLPKPPEQHNSTPATHVPMADQSEPVPVFERETLAHNHPIIGPALIVETVSTTFVAPGWQLSKDDWGHLQLTQLMVC